MTGRIKTHPCFDTATVNTTVKTLLFGVKEIILCNSKQNSKGKAVKAIKVSV